MVNILLKSDSDDGGEETVFEIPGRAHLKMIY